MENVCKNCRHWRQIPAKSGGIAPDVGLGRCHRNPPSGFSNWPRSAGTDTCGEFVQQVAFASGKRSSRRGGVEAERLPGVQDGGQS